MSSIFRDSKTFVDMPLKTDVYNMPVKFNNEKDLRLFFEPANSDMKAFFHDDYTNANINVDPTHEKWANDILDIYISNTKKTNVSKYQAHRHSLINLPFSFVSTSGRFQEIYYWDSYWIILGLLSVGCFEIAKDIVMNLLYLCKTYGFVPNGGRKYYTNRSQPPLLSKMIRNIYEYSRDKQLLQFAYDILQTEYSYWMSPEKCKTFQGYHVNTYAGKQKNSIRVESYVEDFMLTNDVRHQMVCVAESGWDFSSRWRNPKTNILEISDIIPVDLNSIMYDFEENMAYFSEELDYVNGHSFYTSMANNRKRMFRDVLWNHDRNIWCDRNLKTGEFKDDFIYVSSWFPLWVNISTKNEAILATYSLKQSGLIQNFGVATSTNWNSLDQWDGNNCWPNMNHVVIEGLKKYDVRLSNHLKDLFLNTCKINWKKYGKMFEKYNSKIGGVGGNGEYNVQSGFGWTNGIVLNLLTFKKKKRQNNN